MRETLLVQRHVLDRHPIPPEVERRREASLQATYEYLGLNADGPAYSRITKRCGVQRRYVSGRAFDVPVNVLDTTLAARTLGWQPSVPFRDGLERTLMSLQRARGAHRILE